VPFDQTRRGADWPDHGLGAPLRTNSGTLCTFVTPLMPVAHHISAARQYFRVAFAVRS
jgi:hypothetical protein